MDKIPVSDQAIVEAVRSTPQRTPYKAIAKALGMRGTDASARRIHAIYSAWHRKDTLARNKAEPITPEMRAAIIAEIPAVGTPYLFADIAAKVPGATEGMARRACNAFHAKDRRNNPEKYETSVEKMWASGDAERADISWSTEVKDGLLTDLFDIRGHTDAARAWLEKELPACVDVADRSAMLYLAREAGFSLVRVTKTRLFENVISLVGVDPAGKVRQQITGSGHCDYSSRTAFDAALAEHIAKEPGEGPATAWTSVGFIE